MSEELKRLSRALGGMFPAHPVGDPSLKPASGDVEACVMGSPTLKGWSWSLASGLPAPAPVLLLCLTSCTTSFCNSDGVPPGLRHNRMVVRALKMRGPRDWLWE